MAIASTQLRVSPIIDKLIFGLTSELFLMLGVPQGLSPPEKLGRLRHTIDLILYWKRCVEKTRRFWCQLHHSAKPLVFKDGKLSQVITSEM